MVIAVYVLSGLANGIANFLTLVLAGMENASVLFPIISVGTILVSLHCGRLFKFHRFKQEKQLLPIVTGRVMKTPY